MVILGFKEGQIQKLSFLSNRRLFQCAEFICATRLYSNDQKNMTPKSVDLCRQITKSLDAF